MLAVGTAACGGSTSIAEPQSTTLAYEYTIGETVTFEFSMVQSLTAEIDLPESAGILLNTDVPAEIDITVETTGEISYFINPADNPDKYEIAIGGIITDTSVSGLIDSQDINDFEDLPPDFMPDTAPPDQILIVDRAGVATPLEQAPTDLFAILANPASAASLGGINPMSGHLGPVFVQEPLSAGDTWQIETAEDILGTPMTITSSHRIADVTDTNGANVARIVTDLDSSGFELSLGTLLSLLFGGADDLVDGAAVGDISSQIGDSGFDLQVVGSPMTGDSTAEFDVDAGRLLRFRSNSESPVEVTLSFPDEETGEPVTGLMDLITTVEFEAELQTG